MTSTLAATPSLCKRHAASTASGTDHPGCGNLHGVARIKFRSNLSPVDQPVPAGKGMLAKQAGVMRSVIGAASF